MDSSGAPLPLQDGPIINVVDSSSLAVTAVTPSSVRVGEEVQVKTRKTEYLTRHFMFI
jgi:hypothetical protein